MKRRRYHFTLPQRRSVLLAVLVLLILLCQYALWVSHSGISGLVKLRAEVAQMQSNNHKDQQRNHALYQRIQALRHSNAAIEGLARSQLGLIQQGETFYHVVKQPVENTQKPADSLASAPSVAKLDNSNSGGTSPADNDNKDSATHAHSRNQ